MATLKPVAFTDKQLEDSSNVSPTDIELAIALWRATVQTKWKELLDSQTIGIDKPITTPYAWSASENKYVEMKTKRFVPFETIRKEAIEPMIAKSKAYQRQLSQQLQAGTMSLADWQSAMMQNIKSTQIASALAANGGKQNTNEGDWKKVAALVLALFLLFKTFYTDIATKKQALNGTLLVRSDLYANTPRSTFQEVLRFGTEVNFGTTQERRILGDAEHCRSAGEFEGCVELANKGWQPSGILPPIGKTPCRTNCKCRFIYRYMGEDGNWIYINDIYSSAAFLF